MLNRVRKCLPLCTALILTFGMLLTLYRIAHAYVLYQGKWSGFPIYYIRSTVSPAGSYLSVIDSGVSSWNATPTKARIYLTAPGYEKVDIHAEFYGDPATCNGVTASWYACATNYPSPSANPYTYGFIKVNRTVIEANNWSGLHTQSTVAHEVGHILGLDHNTNPSFSCTLMYFLDSYPGCGTLNPTSDEISGINAKYP